MPKRETLLSIHERVMTMSSREKGNRNERKARDVLKEDGYRVHKTAGGMRDNDAFDIADLIAFNDEEVLLVQVKTNGFGGISDYEGVCRLLSEHMPDNMRIEIWSRYDGKGGRGGYPAAWRKKRWNRDDCCWDEYYDGRVDEQIG